MAHQDGRAVLRRQDGARGGNVLGHGCQIGHKHDAATIYSKAFAGATKTKFAGVPSVSASLSKSKTGAFSIKVKLSKKLSDRVKLPTGVVLH